MPISIIFRALIELDFFEFASYRLGTSAVYIFFGRLDITSPCIFLLISIFTFSPFGKINHLENRSKFPMAHNAFGGMLGALNFVFLRRLFTFSPLFRLFRLSVLESMREVAPYSSDRDGLHGQLDVMIHKTLHNALGNSVATLHFSLKTLLSVALGGGDWL